MTFFPAHCEAVPWQSAKHVNTCYYMQRLHMSLHVRKCLFMLGKGKYVIDQTWYGYVWLSKDR
ncbi:hypothetical protein SPHINGOT1_490050 [Sphingomonas sp. T1]|nr:hypothetical protein SPHINGOT1_490050 [Sphingomonas sp. T1]